MKRGRGIERDDYRRDFFLLFFFPTLREIASDDGSLREIASDDGSLI